MTACLHYMGSKFDHLKILFMLHKLCLAQQEG